MPRGVYDRSKMKSVVNVPAAVSVAYETDEQILEKLTQRFDTMDRMTKAAFEGSIKSFIISGPAGLGKSFGVMKIADEMKAAGNHVESVKGFIRPTGLYKVLYENRFPNSVVIFDDADAVFFDEDALNILKGACDTMRKREISWRAETNMKDAEGEYLPTSFEFEGTIIFITNTDFDTVIAKGGKLAPHFTAMVSRSMYLDLGMKTTRDYLIRIKQVVDGGMLTNMALTNVQQYELLTFIEKNFNNLRELSLRMVVKLAALIKMDADWQTLAKCTCFKPS